MKQFKSILITIKIRQDVYKILPFITLLSLSLISCQNDDKAVNSETEAESAFVLGYINATPEGEIYYMSVHKEIPSELDISQAVEVGLDVELRALGENVYTFNPGASTITKWEVNKTTLEMQVVRVLSYASTGISFGLSNIFSSETESYLSDLEEGLVMEWNPTTMSITEVYDVGSHRFALLENVRTRQNRGFSLNGNPAWPIKWQYNQCCEHTNPEPGALIGVFDVISKTFNYYSDNRILSADNQHGEDENGNIYVPAARDDAFHKEYWNLGADSNLVNKGILKVNSDGQFDPNFLIDLDEVFNDKITMFGGIVSIYENQFLINYHYRESGLSDEFNNRWDIWDTEGQFALVDGSTKEVTQFNGFDGMDLAGAWSLTTIDGVNYLGASRTGWEDALLLRQDSRDTYSIISEFPGSNGEFNRLAELW
ncbi:MAG: hypothetical protein AAF600_14400 [Bacteroidota bacterium]